MTAKQEVTPKWTLLPVWPPHARWNEKSRSDSVKVMALKVLRLSDDLYSVVATPPEVNEEWSPPEPLRGRQLTRTLIERGAHQIDVGDAMNEADPDWIRKLRDPYIPPSTR